MHVWSRAGRPGVAAVDEQVAAALAAQCAVAVQRARLTEALLLNERLVLRDFDPLAAGGAKNVATVREFKSVQPVNGMLTIGFEKERQSPCVNGIEIVSE